MRRNLQFYPCSCRAPLLVIMNYWSTLSERQFGRLDGILHNAGILGERTELENYPVDVWDDVMAVNLRAPFVMTQELMPLLKKI